MAVLLYLSQNFSTTLNVAGGIDNSQTTGIILTSVSGLDTNGGILCFNWADPLDTDNAEYIEYGGVSGNTLTGVTRNVEGISAKAHVNGSTIVAVVSKSHLNRINDRLNNTDTTGITVGTVDVQTSDMNLATGLNIQVNSADPKRAYYIPAQGMYASTTSGAASGQLETTTNQNNIKVFDFDTGSDEYVHFIIPTPKNWDASTVTAEFIWTAASGSGGVTWAIQGVATANDDALDVAFGTAVTADDTLITAEDQHTSPATSAVTIAGSPVAGELVEFRILRDVSDANDTLGVDARLIAARIEFGIAKYTDA